MEAENIGCVESQAGGLLKNSAEAETKDLSGKEYVPEAHACWGHHACLKRMRAGGKGHNV